MVTSFTFHDYLILINIQLNNHISLFVPLSQFTIHKKNEKEKTSSQPCSHHLNKIIAYN
jgi:hypothetical protein